MPSGTVHDEYGLCTWRDIPADLFDVELHSLGVGMRQDEGCSRSACRTDGTEEIGAFKTLVGWLPWAGAAPCPLPGHTILLADPRLVLKPNLNWLFLWHTSEMSTQCS